MNRVLRLAATSLLMVAAACSPLGVFDTVAPWDAGASRIAQSLPYGPLPRQSLDVYVPKPKPASAPVLIFFYGGAWSSGSKEEYGFVGAAFAAQGFVTIVPDYRLFPEVQFPDFLRDSAQAVRWAQQNATAYGGNPRHVVLVGHSAGAYNAIMLGLDQRFLEAAGVDATAIRAVAGLAGPYDFLPLDDPATINTFGRAVDLAATQPVNFAQANSPPVFLATGEDDDRVRPRHTKALESRLQSVGAKVEAKFYPDLGHVGILLALSKPLRRNAPVLGDASRFLHARSGSHLK
jgi:acetyl esterase/lipase